MAAMPPQSEHRRTTRTTKTTKYDQLLLCCVLCLFVLSFHLFSMLFLHSLTSVPWQDAHAKKPKMVNPRVYFDVSIGNEPAGRVVMEVFDLFHLKISKSFLWFYIRWNFACLSWLICNVILSPFPHSYVLTWCPRQQVHLHTMLCILNLLSLSTLSREFPAVVH
jgi:hypothetical protein